MLWVLSGDDDLGTAFLAELASIDGPALSVDPADAGPVEVIGTAEDPLSQIPQAINGATTETRSFPVSAILEGVDPSDSNAVADADRLRALLTSVGGVDRATIISSQARADDGGIVILGLNVDGADHAAFRDGFLDLFVLRELEEPLSEETQLAGKAVTRVSDARALSGTEAWVYGIGETVWVLRGQDEYLVALLRTMP